MRDQRDKALEGVTLDIDDTRFIRCKLYSCTVRYSGGECEFLACDITNNQIVVAGAAQRTMKVLESLGFFNKVSACAAY
ncbi:MAG: hypothetical protein ABR881_31570 [Candidatus Sulfotelmatobacter sp.]